jgi:hypothetical protein
MLYYMVIETININVFTADVACVYVRLRYEIWKWEAVKESIKVGNNIQHTELQTFWVSSKVLHGWYVSILKKILLLQISIQWTRYFFKKVRSKKES